MCTVLCADNSTTFVYVSHTYAYERHREIILHCLSNTGSIEQNLSQIKKQLLVTLWSLLTHPLASHVCTNPMLNATHAVMTMLVIVMAHTPDGVWQSGGFCSAELFLNMVSLVLFTPLLLNVHTYITHILLSPVLWPVAEWGFCSAELFLNLVSFFELHMMFAMPRGFTKKNGDFVLRSHFSQSCYHCQC